jgi:hypothetical protein
MTGPSLAEVTQLAGEDPRAARLLASAEAGRIAAEQQRLSEDAAAEREARAAERALQRDQQRRTGGDTRRAELRAQRRVEQAARRAARAERAASRRAWVSARIDYVRANFPGVLSFGIYGLAAYDAVQSQIEAMTGRGWSLSTSIGIAAVIETVAVSMALTAHHQRLKGERAMVPRALTWVCAGGAAAINYSGHIATDALAAVVGAALSLLAITVWEVRAGAKHRQALREAGMIPDPPAQFGWRRWVRYPRSTFAAWSHDIRDRVSPGAAVRFAELAAERTVREVTTAARRELRAASKRGDGPGVVDALTRLAGGRSAPVRPDGDADRHADQGPDGPADGDADGRTDTRTDVRTYAREDRRTEPDAGQVTTGTATEATGGPSARAARGPAADRTGRSARTVADRDVSDLLPIGRTVRDQLAAQGQALTRTELVRAVRSAGHTVSNDRAAVLLDRLNTELHAVPSGVAV